MKKTSIYLEPELDEALARRAAVEGLSKAEYIRRTLAGATERPRRPKAAGGIYAGDGESAANNVDRWLAETGFGAD